ncbi:MULTISPECIES: hypothetical protein [Providencia]|uniref:hypothetical protein n=1 Tax=Providencia TaxID=586 RepID=UPI00234A0344|nr:MULTISPECIES: hypothetical protein [Providencia]MDH2364487.1 hypothetical protein [Providencia rettgeri]
MNHYSFFMKAGKVIAIVTPNEQETQKLITAGYEKQFEEIEAVSTEKALERFANIRGEEVKNIYALTGSDILLGIVGAFAMVFK